MINKIVNLVVLSKTKIPVSNYGDFLDYKQDPNITTIDNTTDEFVSGVISDSRLKRTKIRKVVEEGNEYYLAVDDKVWEFLYTVKNPVNAKVLVSKIDDLEHKEKINTRAIRAKDLKILQLKNKLKHLSECGILCRLKFLVTGIIVD